MKRVNLHKKLSYDYDRRTITAPSVNDTWCLDLVDMNSDDLGNSGYIMNVVDITSRYAQAVAMTHKDTEDIRKAFIEIIRLFGGKTPNKLWCDKEAAVVGLKNWFSSQYKIELYHTNNSYLGPGHSVSIVERFNRSMNEAMTNYEAEERPMNTKQLIHFTINKFIPFYNSKVHTTIQMTPDDAFRGAFKENLIEEQQKRAAEPKKQPKQLLKVGDRVHLQNKYVKIRGKKKPKYSVDVYTITGIKPTNPTTYTISDFGDTAFYKQQFIMAADAKPEELGDDTEIESEPEKEPVKAPPRRSNRLILFERLNKRN